MCLLPFCSHRHYPHNPLWRQGPEAPHLPRNKYLYLLKTEHQLIFMSATFSCAVGFGESVLHSACLPPRASINHSPAPLFPSQTQVPAFLVSPCTAVALFPLLYQLPFSRPSLTPLNPSCDAVPRPPCSTQDMSAPGFCITVE